MKPNNNETMYWTESILEQFPLVLVATSRGLCYAGAGTEASNEFIQWAKKHLPSHTLVRDDKQLRPYTEEFAAYERGDLTMFTLPLDYYGTAFQRSVWTALHAIPYGQTCSYTELAVQLQRPDAVRAVSTAIGANPILIAVPCHRVIGKNGALTGYRGGLEMKAALLELEKES
ncbi:methylated-DNA--[protein]-cysteine S-methyltransferase [Paenibacillus cremeus]|uniref:methylated-DNA--[protein]-cysteine S-methyltransferase n=1 Tax=Paenibacillus cremeus TaxID=2163881 RepID=A0A559KEJ1_9BACL|nr:methylated-DNA--[protein]-cysteine S-methyltransferase [Paenibacillus cremeus]TVY10541.1 methylated-DNA--[protein]-cysteine S-methyltransferase [Paenibacillus cremeus]